MVNARALVGNDFPENTVVMTGCPKFDDIHEYAGKFAAIFKTAGIKSVTTVIMEVPCCSGLPVIVKKGMAEANKQIPIKEIILSAQGEILKQ
ncbi:MAG: hypothetical protein ABFD50_21355 [Smithella sp.]